MRSEKEMFDLILGTARADERIRAVFMNGSRTNPNAPRDIFQDYDIVYAVRETASFIADKGWIDRFGDILYMQYPDEFPDLYDSDPEHSYGYLMQFTDGVRLDLTVQELNFARENILKDSLCAVLLDKDGCLPPVPPSSDSTYLITRPTETYYSCTCNEFWWCLNNVAKGIWRGEVTYVQDMLSFVVRKQLEQMLKWKVGILTDFTVSAGKSGKYLHRWLPEADWQSYLSTYCGGDVADIIRAAETMCRLFFDTSEWVAERLGFGFNRQEAENSWGYLKKVIALPKDAKEIF